MATFFATFGKTIGNNKGSVQNFAIVGVTIATEELSKFIFFFCPCDYPANKVYGSIFIWGPGIILLIAGFLANRRTWRLTTGLCNRTQGVGKYGKRIFHFIYIFLSIGMKAMLAPATWVVLAFLKGDYYACANWPDPNNVVDGRILYQLKPSNDSLPRPCMFNSNPVKFDGSDAEIIARNLRAQSHTIGWLYVSIGMLLGVFGMFCMRCRSKYSYEQSNYIDRYRANEIKLFEAELDKKAEEQAQRIVEGYFTKPRAKEEWDQIAVINDKVTRSKRGRAIYSPLHKFVNRELRANENAEVPNDLVHDAAMKKKNLLPKKDKKTTQKNGDNGGSGPGLQLMPIITTGRKSKPVLLSKPIELKTDGFVDPPSKDNAEHPHASSPTQPTTTVVIENENQPTSEGSGNDPLSSANPHSFPVEIEIPTSTAAPLLPQKEVSDNPNKKPVKPQQPESAAHEGSYHASSTTDLKDPELQEVPNAEAQNLTTARTAIAGNVLPSEQNVPSDIPPQLNPENLPSTNAVEIPPSNQTISSAIPPPPKQSRPLSYPSVENSVKPAITETSLGDFGGAISRENLREPDSSGESNDGSPGVIVFEGQDLPPDLDVNTSEQPDNEGYVPLLGDGDDTPLLSDE